MNGEGRGRGYRYEGGSAGDDDAGDGGDDAEKGGDGAGEGGDGAGAGEGGAGAGEGGDGDYAGEGEADAGEGRGDAGADDGGDGTGEEDLGCVRKLTPTYAVAVVEENATVMVLLQIRAYHCFSKGLP